jgi:hypothetical protein
VVVVARGRVPTGRRDVPSARSVNGCITNGLTHAEFGRWRARQQSWEERRRNPPSNKQWKIEPDGIPVRTPESDSDSGGDSDGATDPSVGRADGCRPDGRLRRAVSRHDDDDKSYDDERGRTRLRWRRRRWRLRQRGWRRRWPRRPLLAYCRLGIREGKKKNELLLLLPYKALRPAFRTNGTTILIRCCHGISGNCKLGFLLIHFNSISSGSSVAVVTAAFGTQALRRATIFTS